MVRFISAMHSLVRDDHGATAIEYGLIATLIAVVLITALTAVGGQLTHAFQTVVTALGG